LTSSSAANPCITTASAARQQGKGDPAQANADARLAEEAGVGTAEGRRNREEADADEAFRREEAARRSVSDDAAAKAAQDLAKEQERRDAEEEKAAEESRKRAEAEAAGDSKPAGHGKGK
jgi:colicin import membrane protein